MRRTSSPAARGATAQRATVAADGFPAGREAVKRSSSPQASVGNRGGRVENPDIQCRYPCGRLCYKAVSRGGRAAYGVDTTGALPRLATDMLSRGTISSYKVIGALDPRPGILYYRAHSRIQRSTGSLEGCRLEGRLHGRQLAGSSAPASRLRGHWPQSQAPTIGSARVSKTARPSGSRKQSSCPPSGVTNRTISEFGFLTVT